MILFNFILLFYSLEAAAKDKNPGVTNYVTRLKQLEEFLMVISLLACIAIVVAFVYFAFRYKRKATEEQGAS